MRCRTVVYFFSCDCVYCFLIRAHINSNYTIIPMDNAMYRTSGRRNLSLYYIGDLTELQHARINLEMLLEVK